MLRAQGLHKRYGPNIAVEDLSLRFEHPSLNGLLGANGAGKSTAMRMLTGVLRPDAGSVHAFDECVSAGASAARRHIGYLPENTPLPASQRVDAWLDFCAELRGLRGASRRDALARVVHDCGLLAKLRARIGSLSKGTRQRVGLAQALLGAPEILVLDEPTSGLDPGEQVRIRELLSTLGRRHTILVSSHQLSEVQEIATRVVILARGRLVAEGSPLELAAREHCALRVVLRFAPEQRAAQSLSALEALGALGGVRSARVEGGDEHGRVGFALEVEERWSGAELVAELARREGWRLCELSAERIGLEHVFLRQVTRAGERTQA